MSEKRINEALFSPGTVPLWATDLKYQHVFDREFKAPRKVQEIIGYDIEAVLKLRTEAKTSGDDTRFRCIACDSPLALLSTSDRSGFYFKHKHYVDSCPIKDERSLPPDVLRAKKFNGNQESAAHEYMKALLYRLIALDSRFVNIEKETVRKDHESKEWKKPDISGEFLGEKVVFEIQLSTELLDVIVRRREFYKKTNTLLVWVFQAFSFDKARISDLDISYSNNNNIIVLDAESTEKTFSTGELHFSCHWRQVEIQDGSIKYIPKEEIFNFNKLHKDFSESRIFHYDFTSEDIKARQKLFTELWTVGNVDQYDNEKAYAIIKQCYGINIEEKKNLARLIHSIWVARTGIASGWKYTPEEVFHKLFDRYKDIVYIYMAACSVYKRKLPDKKGLIALKKKQILDSLFQSSQKHPSPYQPNDTSLEVVRTIFPTLYNHIKNAPPYHW